MMKYLMFLPLLAMTLWAGEQQQKSESRYWYSFFSLRDMPIDSLRQEFINAEYDNAPIDSKGIEIPNIYYRRVSEDEQVGWLKIGRRIKTERNGGPVLWYYNIETYPIFDLTNPKEKK